MSNPSDMQVLLIDDEEDILDVVGIMLSDAGYTVKTAGDGEAGIAVCAEIRPDIVITDIRMPKKDGLQVLAHIKKYYPEIEVIVATAFGEMALAVSALRLDASDFITKPIAAEALMVALDRAGERLRTRKKLADYTALLEIRRLEQQMRDQAHILHQDKMMSLGRLAASVAHEINNPLAGVLNYVRLMRRISAGNGPTAEEMAKFRSYLGTVENEVDRCSRIVGSLLTFSRKSDVVFESVDLCDLVERCMILSGHRLELSNIEVELQFKDSLPHVRGDSNQLQQCLINLIFNAADAMPNGGRLEITAGSGSGGKEVVLALTDNGCGIATEDIPHIFEPFFTTKQAGKGTGLGLSTTYGIIASHHGTISVRSSPGEKTTFTIKLPTENRAP